MTSYESILNSPNEEDLATHVVPGALKYYDLTYLANAIAPKPLTISSDYLTEISEISTTNNNALHNYPNPFKVSTNINYTIAESGHVSIQIYDQVGRLVDMLVNEYQDANAYTVQFEASSLTSGIYFYQLIVDNKQIGTKKMIVLP